MRRRRECGSGNAVKREACGSARDTELEHVDLSGGRVGGGGGERRGCQPRWALQSVRGRREESGVTSGGGEPCITRKKTGRKGRGRICGLQKDDRAVGFLPPRCPQQPGEDFDTGERGGDAAALMKAKGKVAT